MGLGSARHSTTTHLVRSRTPNLPVSNPVLVHSRAGDARVKLGSSRQPGRPSQRKEMSRGDGGGDIQEAGPWAIESYSSSIHVLKIWLVSGNCAEAMWAGLLEVI